MSFDKKWRVSLTSDFMALETRSYQSRSNFIERLAFLLESLESSFAPGVVTRIGLRYLSRIKGEEFKRKSELFNENFKGILGSVMEDDLLSSSSESLLQTEEGKLTLRLGVMPAATQIPDLLAPLKTASVVLDIDSFCEEEMKFVADDIRERISRLAERAYAVFRATVTPEFLQAYGGKI